MIINKFLYRRVGEDLRSLYGENKGNYILGRLSADEIEEFGYTNSITGTVANKRDLKWTIIKRKLN